jgi:hypothetical protein
VRCSSSLPALYLLGRQRMFTMDVTIDTVTTATIIGTITITVIIVIGFGLPMFPLVPATTATIETSPLFQIAHVLVRFNQNRQPHHKRES